MRNYVLRFIKQASVFVAFLVLMSWRSQATAGHQLADFPSFIPFSFTNYEFAEGVTVDRRGNVYTSLRQSPLGYLNGLSDQILKFTPHGVSSTFADFGSPGGGAAGLAMDKTGNVYMARTLSGNSGVFRVNHHGKPVLLPGTNQIVFPDGLAFDKHGNLFITETFSLDIASGCLGMFGQGGIWIIPHHGGSAELWLRHEELTGACPPGALGIPIGANGIVYYHHALYVVNTDKGTIVRVPVNHNGSPGQPEVWAVLKEVPESPFMGYSSPIGDGLALDAHGNIYVAVINRNAIVRIDAADKTQTTLAVLTFDPKNPLFAPLDFPASLAFGKNKCGRTSLFVTNLGWLGILAPPYQSWYPGPGLVKIDLPE